VDGLKLHYLTAGHGPTVILLQGYTQTSRIWKPIIPLLAAKFTVIAPDLPGIGDSGIPTNGLDMKSAAISIRSLVFRLKVRRRKRWYADASELISSTTGMTSRPTRHIRFQKPIA
jgi:pimeloyl-ACP methyl ester carboxylesterase